MIIEWYLGGEGILPGADALLQLAADAAQGAEGISVPCAIAVHMVNNEEIAKINGEHRGIHRETDVLSFPAVTYPRDGRAGRCQGLLRKAYDDDINGAMLGDLFLSVEKAREQAAAYGHSLEREMAYLCVHGIFHLMGYDHETEWGQKEMREMEEKALEMIHITRDAAGMPTDESLLRLAVQAKERAYVPYSKYRVGAAILAEDGRVFQGCNVENASYGLSNCGERTAIFKAISEGAQRFLAIAIAADGSAPWPCGACRQVLNEFAPGIRVLVTWGDGHVEKSTLDVLLPHGFGPESLPTT